MVRNCFYTKYNPSADGQNTRYNSHGFTLIELIVVISIALVIGSIGIASFVTLSTRQTVEQEAFLLKQAIDEARFSAGSLVKPDIPQPSVIPALPDGSPSNCNRIESERVLDGYRFDIVSANAYRIVAECGFENPPVPVDVLIRQTLLPTGVTIVTAPSPTCTSIRFTTVPNTITCVSGTLPTQIVLRKTGTPDRIINVTADGFTRVQ